ncbi:MAG TPA: histidine kinase [Cytophagales bacterium]|nr:histidine kinase [Cytophagales bacterium]
MSQTCILVIILAVVVVVSGFFLGLMWGRYSEERKSRTALEEKQRLLEQKVQALEMEKIHYKLSPHLFKNTLNTIQSHAYQTYYSLDKLSNVLDYILYESDRQYVSLKEDMEFAMNLIDIYKLKMSPMFDLRIKNKINDSDPLFHEELIAPLITIDLVENAFKHADLQHENAFISIMFELKDGVFSLIVTNRISNASPLKKEYSGFGRAHFKSRLSAIYKDAYTLEQFSKDEVFVSQLKLNLLEHKTEMLTSG